MAIANAAGLGDRIPYGVELQVRNAIATAIEQARAEALEEAAREAERGVVEYRAIDEMDMRPTRVRIASRIRALAAKPGEGR
jgi:hypothetical protein